MNEIDQDKPGIIAFPPLIFLVFLLTGLALDYLWRVAVLPDRVQYAAGVAVIALSGVIVAFTLRQVRKARTNFSPFKPTTALITGGPFRFSRNPAYLSLSLLYTGIGVTADNLWMLGLLVPTLMVMHYGVISREEQYLQSKFVEEYLRYKTSVRLWLL